jgi:hypothetical protein
VAPRETGGHADAVAEPRRAGCNLIGGGHLCKHFGTRGLDGIQPERPGEIQGS